MKKLLFGLIILLSACSKEVTTPEIPKPKLSLSIDPLLPKDSNGYYHFLLYNRVAMGNNTHEIGGIALINDKPPQAGEQIYVTYESSHYGILPAGWSIISATKSYINVYTGQWTKVNLPTIIAQKDYILPTIKDWSLINRLDGGIHNVIEPTYDMKGDTMIISAKYIYSYVTKMDGAFENAWSKDSVIDIKKIILE
jgi:hypothetical protein